MKKPRIALVTSVIDNRTARGTALVARRLLEGLIPYADEFDITLIHHEHTNDPVYQHYQEQTIPHLRTLDKQVLREALFWTKHIMTEESFDLVHYLHPRVWPSYLLSHAKKVMIGAYEGAHMLPANHPNGENATFRFTSRFLNWRMHLLTACSEFGRREIVSSYRIPPGRVCNIYLGVDSHYRPLPLSEASTTYLRERYNISTPYLLAVSRFDPHKNIDRLLAAYVEAVATGVPMKLVLVGGRHTPKYSDAIEAAVAQINNAHTGAVTVIPYVEDEDMPLLYNHAKALVYPSLHEGFGLPPLEAMACGTPVLSSNTSSLPEVVGGAALLFDPTSTVAIKNAIITFNAMSPHDIVQMRTAGLAQSKKFSWDTMTRDTVQLYRDLTA